MKALAFLLGFALLAGCETKPQPRSSSTAALPPKLDAYFVDFCDDTGSLGIGFVASHSYDLRFRQHLKQTHDPELKRLFVLYRLHEEVEYALHDFENDRFRTGKVTFRPFTPEERQASHDSIRARIDDLAAFAGFANFATLNRFWPELNDPTLESSWIEELRERLRIAEDKHRTGAQP